MSAWLYKSGKLYDVEENHGLLLRDKFGLSGVVSDGIERGFVRMRYISSTLAIQARSKELACKAANTLFLSNKITPKDVVIEFPGRYIEMCFPQFLDWV